LRGVPDLANCDRFQREVECACDGGGNHDSASRKADHNCVLIFDPRPKLVGENAACVRAVVEREQRQLAAPGHDPIIAATLIVSIGVGSDRRHGKPTGGLRPYDLRHSFASLLIAEQRNPAEGARQLGHTLQTLEPLLLVQRAL
jgi:hypothetical protein